MNFNKYIACCYITLVAGLVINLKAIAQSVSHSTTYYVSSSGNDSNPGTKTAPFKTINKLNSIKLVPGDIICFKSGQVFNGTITVASNILATQALPVIITSYGQGNAIINAANEDALIVKDASYITIKNLSFEGSGRKTGNTKNGVQVLNSHNILVNALDIHGFQKSGLLIYASANVAVKNVFTHDNGSAGITVEGPYGKKEAKDIKITNCRAENNPGDPTNLTNHSGNGIVVGNCKKILIDHCTATNNGWGMPRIGNGPVGIWAYEADSVIIQNCLSYRNKTSKGGADGGGFDLDGGVTNSIIQYCFSYENQGSGYCIFQYWGASSWHDNIIRYNITENDGTVSDSQAGIYIWNSSDDEKQFYNCDVYGNIVYNSKVAAISFSDKSENKGFHFHDNILVGKDNLIKGKDKIGECEFTGNDWWSLESGFNIDGIKSLKTWSTQTGKEQKNRQIVGLNIKPDFKKPSEATFTTFSQVINSTNYLLSPKSSLRDKPVFNSRYGVNNIKF